MKNKEEPSANSQRGNPSRQVDLDRPDDVGRRPQVHCPDRDEPLRRGPSSQP